MVSSHLKPLTSVWLKNSDGTFTEAKIETRRGGVYQIIVAGETRRVTRNQITRMGNERR